uniref:Zinc finger protein 235 n=2 Tax=Cacopsylla melanoneura TaxID=428564 RepID=A0A8D8YKI0_9HEMI
MTSLGEEIAEFNELCRVCANKTNVLLALNIFEGDGSNRAIYKKINKCLPIKVSMDDKLPKLICEECVYKLDLLNEFQDISSKTEVFLNNLLNRIFLTAEQNAQSILGVPCSLVPINISHVLDRQDKIHDSNCIDSGHLNDLDSSLTTSQLGLKSETSNRDEDSKEMEGITYIVTAEPLEGATFFFCVLCSKTFGDRNAFDSHCADAHWSKCDPCGLLFSSQDAYAMHCADIHSMGNKPPSTDVSFILSHMESYRQLPQNIPMTSVLANGSLVGTALAPGSTIAPSDLQTITLTSLASSGTVVADVDQFGRSGHTTVNTSNTGTLPHSNTLATFSDGTTGSIPVITKVVDRTKHVVHSTPTKPGDHSSPKQTSSNSAELSTTDVTNNCELSTTDVTNNSILSTDDVTNSFDSVQTSLNENINNVRGGGGGNEEEEVGREDGSSCDEPGGGMDDDSEDEQDDPTETTKVKFQLRQEDPSKEQIKGDCNQKTEGTSNEQTKGDSNEQTKGQRDVFKQPTPGVLFKQLTKGLAESEEVQPLYKCPLCSQQFALKKTYETHVLSHGVKSPFQCSTCNKQFRSKIGLDQHEAKHSGQFKFECNACGKGFQSKSYLIVHQRVHNNKRDYNCKTCGRGFKTKASLHDHVNRHLGVKPYQCQVCGRGFITKGLCKSHEKIHSGNDNRQYPCPVCHKLFVSKSYLNTHVRIHSGDKPFKCEYCDKGFLTKIDLRIHKTMHTGEKAFVCETCGKAFARRDALRCHTRSHTGERPYRCNICGQTFTQFTPMSIHKRLHTGERPYPCNVCSKAFVSRSTMISHRKKHDKEGT